MTKRILVTGVSGYVGAALVPRLQRAGHEIRGFDRAPERVAAAGVQLDDLVIGDAVSGTGLGKALDGVDAAYYLIHSMEGATNSEFAEHERRAAERFATAARAAGVRHFIYVSVAHPAPVMRAYIDARRAAEALAREIERISAVAEQNAATSHQVSAVVEEQTASMTHVTESSQHLAEIATRLKGSMTRFTL